MSISDKMSNNNDQNVEKFDLSADVGAVKLDDVQVAYAGMPKEVLLTFSQTPFWNRFRRITMWIFWLIWLALIATVIGLSVTYKGCEPKPSLRWWEERLVYQIHPRTFKDSNGNKIGDLKGLQSKLGYLKDLGVGVIWLKSLFKSSDDPGLGLEDHKSIDPDIGNMSDFESLVTAVHDNGMKLMVDFIPNHTSDRHPWFMESSRGNTDKYRNYYIWHECGQGDQPPNNWLDVYRNTSWSYDSTRGMCYYHAFHKSQPDLNLRNNRVKEDLDEILRFWLNKGVDGFNIRDLGFLFEDYDLRNETETKQARNVTTYTRNQPEIYELITRWRSVLQEFSQNSATYRILVTFPDAGMSQNDVNRLYGPTDGSGIDVVINSGLSMSLNRSCDGKCFRQVIENWDDFFPTNAWPNWMLSNEQEIRVASKLGEKFVSAVNMMLLMLPGTPFTYYGEEIGMTDNLTVHEPRDPMKGKDIDGILMKWNSTESAERNDTVETQEQYDFSPLNIFKGLGRLRQDGGLRNRNITFVSRNDNVLSFFRTWDGEKRFLVTINFGNESVAVDFTNPENAFVPKDAKDAALVVVATRQELLSITIDKAALQPGDGVVFQWNYVLPYLAN